MLEIPLLYILFLYLWTFILTFSMIYILWKSYQFWVHFWDSFWMHRCSSTYLSPTSATDTGNCSCSSSTGCSNRTCTWSSYSCPTCYSKATYPFGHHSTSIHPVQAVSICVVTVWSGFYKPGSKTYDCQSCPAQVSSVESPVPTVLTSSCTYPVHPLLSTVLRHIVFLYPLISPCNPLAICLSTLSLLIANQQLILLRFIPWIISVLSIQTARSLNCKTLCKKA